jgi:uncharacterized membrane protein YhaH (DUF805 family)
MLSAMFSFHGRIGRMQYFLRSMALGAAIGIVVAIGCASLVGGGGLEALRNGQPPAGGSLVLIALLALIALPAAFWSSLSLQARRFRDIGWNPIFVMPAWIAVDMIDFIMAKAVPAMAVGRGHHATAIGALVGLALSGSLLFWPGNGEGGETYAPPPPEPRDPVDRFRAKPAPTPVRDPAPARVIAPVQASGPVTGFGRRGL